MLALSFVIWRGVAMGQVQAPLLAFLPQRLGSLMMAYLGRLRPSDKWAVPLPTSYTLQALALKQ